VLLAAACRLRTNQDRIESDLVENGTNNDQRRLQSNASSSVRNSGGRQKATNKRFEGEDVEGKVFALAVSENTREEETSQRGRRANGSGVARLR
jgi:hypothetical protein